MIHTRFLWLRALFNLQDKEIGLTCDLLNMVNLNLLFIIFSIYKHIKQKLTDCIYFYVIYS